MTRKAAIGALCGLFLATCATRQELDAASTVWADCVAAAVARLDDGRTDPVSVAAGVAPLCAGEYQRFTEMMVSQQITDRGQAFMRAQMRDGEVKTITSAVLIRRSKQR